MSARARRSMEARFPDPHDRAAAEAGGHVASVTLRVRVFSDPPPDNGGCGYWVHVAGTNGGKMRCGSALSWFGKPATPYYCDDCLSANSPARAPS